MVRAKLRATSHAVPVIDLDSGQQTLLVNDGKVFMAESSDLLNNVYYNYIIRQLDAGTVYAINSLDLDFTQ